MPSQVWYIVNTVIGTIPLAAMLLTWIIKTERRLTRIETLLNCTGKDTCNRP